MTTINAENNTVHVNDHVHDEHSAISEKAIATSEVSLQILKTTDPDYTEFPA